jgi:hypothetical protein
MTSRCQRGRIIKLGAGSTRVNDEMSRIESRGGRESKEGKRKKPFTSSFVLFLFAFFLG